MLEDIRSIEVVKDALKAGLFDDSPTDKRVIEYCVSLIDKYENTLKETKDGLANVVNKMCGGSVPRHVFLEAREVYYSVSRSLEKE